MTNALTTTNSNSPASHLPAIDAGIDRLLDWCMSGSERTGTRLTLTNWPSEGERQALQQRRQDLLASMKGDPRATAAAVSDLLGCYRNSLKPDEDAKKVTAKYAHELKDVPSWAVQRTCRAIREGQYPEHVKYAPSTIAIRQLAEGYVTRVRAEAMRIYDVLNAERALPPVSAEERRIVGEGFKHLSERLGMAAEPLPNDPKGDELAAKRERALEISRQKREAAAHQEAAE